MLVTTLLGTLVALAAMAVPQALFAQRIDFRAMIKWLGWLTLLNLILNSLIVYFFAPALVGPLAGYWWLWATLAIDVVIGGVAASVSGDNGDNSSLFLASAMGSGATLLLILV